MREDDFRVGGGERRKQERKQKTHTHLFKWHKPFLWRRQNKETRLYFQHMTVTKKLQQQICNSRKSCSYLDNKTLFTGWSLWWRGCWPAASDWLVAWVLLRRTVRCRRRLLIGRLVFLATRRFLRPDWLVSPVQRQASGFLGRFYSPVFFFFFWEAGVFFFLWQSKLAPLSKTVQQ